MPVQKTLNLLMMFEATGCYCEMTLSKFCFGIANNSESNILSLSLVILYENYILSKFTRRTQKSGEPFETIAIFESAGVLP
jgi:hypothetical protein